MPWIIVDRLLLMLLVDDEIEGMDGNNEGGQNQGESLDPQLSLQMHSSC